MEKNKTYLPNGSVVLVDGIEGRIMICGRLVKKEGEERLYDYTGCRYPSGLNNREDLVYFDNEQLNMVFFLGFQDIEELVYRENLQRIVQTDAENEA